MVSGNGLNVSHFNNYSGVHIFFYSPWGFINSVNTMVGGWNVEKADEPYEASTVMRKL